MDVLYVDELNHSAFVDRYVNTGTPVILRQRSTSTATVAGTTPGASGSGGGDVAPAGSRRNGVSDDDDIYSIIENYYYDEPYAGTDAGAGADADADAGSVAGTSADADAAATVEADLDDSTGASTPTPPSTPITVAWLAEHCDVTNGLVHVFERDPESTAWAGFDFDGMQKIPLSSYLKRLARKKKKKKTKKKGDRSHLHYGFDYNTKCFCPQLLAVVDPLVYFKGDILPHASPPRSGWPALILGPGGSRSAQHVDSNFLPFWLTLLSGVKNFRAVKLDDWREHLAEDFVSKDEGGPAGPLYDSVGNVMVPTDVFDDAVAEREYIGRGVSTCTRCHTTCMGCTLAGVC